MKLPGGLSALLAEQDCALCGAITTRPICSACAADFLALPAQICPVCALPSLNRAVCGRCLRHPPQFDATIAAFAYAPPLDQALQAYKYRHALGLTHFLSALLDQALDASGHSGAPPDVIVPMPLAPSRLAERGFNQALELARPIAKRRGVRLVSNLAVRLHDTPAQASLPWKERARNIRDVFACTLRVDGLRIALVDDVMTTGATLNELARVIKQAGATHVTNWVVARTLPRDASGGTFTDES